MDVKQLRQGLQKQIIDITPDAMDDGKEYDLFELMQIAADCGVNWED